jgi:hypothetical protein
MGCGKSAFGARRRGVCARFSCEVLGVLASGEDDSGFREALALPECLSGARANYSTEPGFS